MGPTAIEGTISWDPRSRFTGETNDEMALKEMNSYFFSQFINAMKSTIEPGGLFSEAAGSQHYDALLEMAMNQEWGREISWWKKENISFLAQDEVGS